MPEEMQDNEIHILRVLREERDWQKILELEQDYTYPEWYFF